MIFTTESMLSRHRTMKEDSPVYFRFREHEAQDSSAPVLLEDIVDRGLWQPPTKGNDYFNITYKQKDGAKKLTAGYFIGVRQFNWEDRGQKRKGVIWVLPKRESLQPEKLLWKCLENSKVRNHLEKCYEIFIDEEPVPIPPGVSDYLTPLIITDFVLRLYAIVKKGIRKSFVQVEQTLHNRVKGKILINRTIKGHLRKNTVNAIDCSFQVQSPDIPENRILKAAFIQCSRYINSRISGFYRIKNLLPYCFPPLENVGERIGENDFNSIHYSPFYKEYKPALKLARVLLKKFGFSVNSKDDLKNETLPFRIDMPELFERYCEALLRERYDDLLAGYGREGYSETRSGSRCMRPDFLLPSLNMIIDSKYKFWVENSIGEEDLRQLSLYGRYKPLLDKLENGYESPMLQFLYPSEDGCEIINFEDNIVNKEEKDFIDIKKYPVKIN
jgi:hypothetical protein